jgi:hypothetical protein
VHKFKETEVVHSATEQNKRRAQWPKLRFKTKRDGFGGKRVRIVIQGLSRKSTLTQGFKKCSWRKLHKGRNGINITVKFYLNHGRQEPEIYIAIIPRVSNMIK